MEQALQVHITLVTGRSENVRAARVYVLYSLQTQTGLVLVTTPNLIVAYDYELAGDKGILATLFTTLEAIQRNTRSAQRPHALQGYGIQALNRTFAVTAEDLSTAS